MRKVLLIGLTLAAVVVLGAAAVYAQGPRGGGNFWPGERGGYGVAVLDVIAETLGLETDALQGELQAGKSVAEIAEAQGVALDDVINALTADFAAELDAAVEAGTITREVADARLTLQKAELEAWLNTAHPVRVAGMAAMHGLMMGGRGGFGGIAALDTVAEALGLENDALLDELQAGKTVAEIAEAQGVALADVIDAVVAAANEELAAAVEAGTLTQAQADAHLALLRANLEVHFTTSLPAFDRPFSDFGQFRGFEMRGRGLMGGQMGRMPGGWMGL